MLILFRRRWNPWLSENRVFDRPNLIQVEIVVDPGKTNAGEYPLRAEGHLRRFRPGRPGLGHGHGSGGGSKNGPGEIKRDPELLHWAIKSGALKSVELDIDSDNNNGSGNPDESAAEEAIEKASLLPGKFVFANIDDDDKDGIPDYADNSIDGEDNLVPVVLKFDVAGWRAGLGQGQSQI